MSTAFAACFSVKSLAELGDDVSFVDSPIPRVVHIVWVGENPQPDFFAPHVDKWRELMPDWTVRVWGNEDIHDGEFPKPALDAIHASTKGVQKADIMKYFILLKHGGVYMDADVVPNRALGPCLANDSVVLCHDLEVTWGYMAVGFMAAVPNHALFKACCNLVLQAELNTPDIHLRTGPRIIGMALELNQEPAGSVSLLPIHAFYRNAHVPERFGTHTYARMWS
jgi:mannosyltransferase OCH1-like enzyme